MSKTVAVIGAMGLAVAIWYGYFWLDEQRRWNRPIQVRDTVPINMDRFRRVL